VRVGADDIAEAELVAIVVDPHPGDTDVVGAEEVGHVGDLADEVERRVLFAVGRLAEAEPIRLAHARDGLVALARIGRVVELPAGGEPHVENGITPRAASARRERR
jgi:hypothetical protein